MSGPRERWLLPAGIEEILPPRAAAIEHCRRDLIDLFDAWGYELVMPPLIEYLDSLLIATGPDVDLQTFKFIDQLNGRLLGVRADMTPQVARIDAHHLREDTPARLCYLGTVLHARPDGFSGTRAPIQVGAELYGHDGVASDCEIICLMLETLARAGIGAVHLDIGHMGIFRALAAQAGLGASQEAALFAALQRKARSEIADVLERHQVGADLARMMSALVDLNGGEEVLERAGDVLAGSSPTVSAALCRLEALRAAMHARVPSTALHFDLAELRGYRYERGVVFAAFVPGHGQEIARGGRYDGIGAAYGRSRPAIGFSTDLKTLASLNAAPEGMPAGAVYAPWLDDAGLQRCIEELRARNERVIVELPGQAGDARAMGCTRVLRRRGQSWEVEELIES